MEISARHGNVRELAHGKMGDGRFLRGFLGNAVLDFKRLKIEILSRCRAVPRCNFRDMTPLIWRSAFVYSMW